MSVSGTGFVLAGLAVVISTVMSLAGGGCSGPTIPDGHFACGSGSCEIGREICIDADGCTTCEPVPAPCDADPSCACLEAVDLTTLTHPCADEGVCEVDGEGIVLACEPLDWGCA